MDSGGRGVHGIVLAGSYPWRNSALERLLPRPLLPVAQQPLISYALRWLHEAGVPAATVCLNAGSRRVQAELPVHAEGWPALDYSLDATPRGPAGCLRDAALATDAQVFVVVDAGSIPTTPLAELLRGHLESGAAGTVAVHAADEGPDTLRRTARPAGVYAFDRSALELVPPTGFHDIKEHLIPRLYAAGRRVLARQVSGPSPRVSDLASYVAVNEWAAAQIAPAAAARAGYRRRGEALVHCTAQVDEDARLLGSVLVGPESTVRGGATLVGPTLLGTRCTVEEDAAVSRTVAWNRCVVGAHAFVDQALLADDARVAAWDAVTAAVHVGQARGQAAVARFFAGRMRLVGWSWRPRELPSARS
jgi:NDP-sugar pyrophosphorylase family protein